MSMVSKISENDEKKYLPFIPGNDENIDARKVKNFEKGGYGMKLLKISEEIKLSKNKFYEDKAAYKERKAPPNRVFLDSSGNPI